MSARRQISIILFCLLSNMVWSQTSSEQIKAVFSEAIDSMIRSHDLDPSTTTIIADSAYRNSIKERQVHDPSVIVIVNGWAIGVVGSGLQQVLSANGTIVSLKPPKNPEAFTISRRFPHGYCDCPDDKTESFWDSVLQPALVTLGAVTIIALFFLVRS